MLKIGSVLDDKYEILRQIGSGGTSKVYLAMNSKLNQQWVIKEISRSIGKKKMEQVEEEAKLMMELDHPAIPRIVDILRYEHAIYIIMDYISGQSLAAILKEEGPHPQAVVLEWARQLADVMEYLHTRKEPIIYHDLKPGNLILKQPENNVKLIDFGEARRLVKGDAAGGGFTHEYASPEQQKNLPPIKRNGKWEERNYKDAISDIRGFDHENIRLNHTDERSDIYCFGCTLYRLLTKSLPPELPEPVGSVRERFPELNISNGMDNIIAKCTQIDPDKRFQSMKELRKALNEVELWDGSYLSKLIGRIRTFVIVLVMSVALLIGGVVCNRMSVYFNNQNYNVLVETDPGVDYETKVSHYIKAIDIDGSNPIAYIKLLQIYKENNSFGDAESQQFITLYNENKRSFDMAKQEYLELNYEIGKSYFEWYTGEGDSFRARVQKAKTYFQYVDENATESFEHYHIAKSYYTLCRFFSQYVLNTQGILEPQAEDYLSILEVIEPCLSNMDTYRSDDAAAVRLAMEKSLLDMLNQNIRGFVMNDIEREKVEAAVTAISDAAAQEAVSRDENVAAQKQVLELAQEIIENAERQYISAERMN